MNWIDDFNYSLTFIEDHLDEEILLEDLAKIAYCTPEYYRRAFSYLTNMSLTEYIRARRMSLAALDILHFPEARIIDIGFKYGYENYNSFNHAFRSIHNIAPSEVRNGMSMQYIPKLSFSLSVQGENEIEYRIERLNAFNVLGFPVPVKDRRKDKASQLVSIWEKIKDSGMMEKFLSLRNSKPSGLLCLKFYQRVPEYFIGVSTTREEENLVRRSISKSMWAVFPGDSRINSIKSRTEEIITQWLPLSGFEYAEGPDMEIYPDPIYNQSKYEIWIPVMKRNFDFIDIF